MTAVIAPERHNHNYSVKRVTSVDIYEEDETFAVDDEPVDKKKNL